jgi:hypothetical protein
MMRHMKRWSMPAIVNLGLSARKLAGSAGWAKAQRAVPTINHEHLCAEWWHGA